MRLEPDSWKREVPETDYRGARTGSTRIYSSDPTRESAYSQNKQTFPLGSNVLPHPAQRPHQASIRSSFTFRMCSPTDCLSLDRKSIRPCTKITWSRRSAGLKRRDEILALLFEAEQSRPSLSDSSP